MIQFRSARTTTLLMLGAIGLAIGCASARRPNVSTTAPVVPRPQIHRLGTIDVDVVETTPFVFHDRLYRFQWNRQGNCYRIIDVSEQREVSTFAPGHAFGCALVVGDTVWVFGVERPRASRIDAFWSKDLH